MTGVNFVQLTLADDYNYVLLDGEQRAVGEPADLFHFTDDADCCSALTMCGVLTTDEQVEQMRMVTGKVDDPFAIDPFAIVFKAVDSSRCHVFKFKTEQDFRTAVAMTTRLWELAHADEIAEYCAG